LAEWFWKGCKPIFVCALRRRESFVLATDTRNPAAFAALERAVPWIPYLVLHPTGFSVPCRLRFTRCALTAPFHHHHASARESDGGLSVFCGTVRRQALKPAARVYPNRNNWVTRRRALWSSDFPPPACAGSDPPPFQNHPEHSLVPGESQAVVRAGAHAKALGLGTLDGRGTKAFERKEMDWVPERLPYFTPPPSTPYRW
jgi:hypothetical protein